jgi:hypothetical protein
VRWVDTPEFRVPFLKTPPTIDGAMNPGEWDDASALSAFVIDGGHGAFKNLAVHQVQPQVYAGYDSTNLYFCFTTPIYPEGYPLKARGTMPDVIVHPENGMSADDHMVIEIRPVRRNPREGWAEDARRLAEEGDDALVWPAFANEGDDRLVW